MKIIAFIILVVTLLPISNGIAYVFTEVLEKPLPKKYFYPLSILILIAMIGLLALLPKCSSEEYIAPNGKTTTEHYEPRV